MTEQEFRDKLKQSVGHAELSSDRQAKVLAGMHGKPDTVRNWGKIRIALVVGLALLLMTGGAVAGSRYLVDWHGEPLQIRQAESDERMMQLQDWRTKGKWASIQKRNEALGGYTGILASKMEAYASSLDQLCAWVTADGTLPWAESIPAGYEMVSGSVQYACGPEGEVKLRSQEITEDGYIISCFDMPKEHRFVAGYTLYLRNAERVEVQIQVNLVKMEELPGLLMEDGGTFTELKVEGVQQAVAIEFNGMMRVTLRQTVQPALAYKVVAGYPEIKESLSECDGIEIGIIGDDTPQALLAIFGLTVQ